MAHTPGEWNWEWSKDISDDGTIAVTCTMAGRDGLPVCEVWGITEANVEANARLIAAAPDLLEAAKDALESLRRLPNGLGAFRVTCMQQLVNAIAKAEGKA